VVDAVNRRSLLKALAALPVVAALTPLVPKKWGSMGPDPRYIETFPIDMTGPVFEWRPTYLSWMNKNMDEMRAEFNDYFINGEHAGYRAKIDWPVGLAKFDDKTMLRIIEIIP
jgi:hypothetical protein